MLAELSIDDLVLIARARLQFGAGLNVITGETGAGKTLLAQAIGLLLGQKGDEDLIRPGASRALVQALFESGDESLAVARELPRGGRSRAHLDGLLSSAAAIEDALRSRIAFYGQLEHTRLLQLERQLDILDAAEPELIAPLLAEYSEAFSKAQGLARELERLREQSRDRAREIDLLEYQVEEIETAQVEPGEDERVAQERERLRHAGKLLERVSGALSLLSGDRESAALDGLRAAQRLLSEASALDPTLDALAGRADALTAESEDVAISLRDYVDGLDADPAHRDALELRHDKLQALKRKYGSSADEILAYLGEAQQRLAALRQFAEDESKVSAALAGAQQAAVAAARRLSEARERIAPGFAERVAAELRDLAMPHATFAVDLRRRADGWDGLGARGAEDAEFLFSANPGVPPRALRDTGSGGELSRAVLAMRSIVTLGHDVETLIFDEVDTGIGGVTATALGERMARLAATTQIICITHLPQVAAYADRHFAIAKLTDAAAGTTETLVSELDGGERIDEICRMLGSAPDDEAARGHAEQLLQRAGAPR
jgi:DNA repair protein RecN (Recombination protein N)